MALVYQKFLETHLNNCFIQWRRRFPENLGESDTKTSPGLKRGILPLDAAILSRGTVSTRGINLCLDQQCKLCRSFGFDAYASSVVRPKVVLLGRLDKGIYRLTDSKIIDFSVDNVQSGRLYCESKQMGAGRFAINNSMRKKKKNRKKSERDQFGLSRYQKKKTNLELWSPTVFLQT